MMTEKRKLLVKELIRQIKAADTSITITGDPKGLLDEIRKEIPDAEYKFGSSSLEGVIPCTFFSPTYKKN